MKRIVPITIVVIIALAGIIFILSMRQGPADQEAPDTPKTSQSEAKTQEPADKIIIKNFEFSAKKTVIKKGTTVTWTNQDDAHHNIVINSGALKGSEGPLIDQGKTYQLTFNETGTYEYHCGPHPYMKATIEVIE